MPPRTRRVGPTAVALVVGLAALTAQASESDLVRDIQRYCTVCWRNARLDPRLWDDCTQEVCCRLLTKARDGQLDLTLVLAEDTPERRELVRAIDMVRKRVQRTKRFQPLDGSTPTTDIDQRNRDRLELGEILEAARRAVLSKRQDRIIELWMRGWSVPEIGEELDLPAHPGQRREIQGAAKARAASPHPSRCARIRPAATAAIGLTTIPRIQSRLEWLGLGSDRRLRSVSDSSERASVLKAADPGRDDGVAVAVHLHAREDGPDDPVRIDDERRSFHAHGLTPVHVLLLPDAVGLADPVLRVGEERER